MNIKYLASTTLALGILAFAGYSHAAEAGATGSATVIVPIAIVKATDLAFGKFAPGAGGTVTVATDNARTASGTILSAIGSTPTAARFNVTGDADATYSIGIVADATLISGANNMALATFSDLTAGGATSGNVTAGTLTGGAQSIYVGGTLTVGAAQVAGAYTGNMTVTVEYN